MTNFRAISPLDGRYQSKTRIFSDTLSEWALMKYRLMVEVRWLVMMSHTAVISDVRALTDDEATLLESFITDFDDDSASHIKEIERTTNHDVKAVEYFLRGKLANTSLADVSEFIHFCCTSADINNLAYAMMIRDAVQQVWLPASNDFVETLSGLAHDLHDVPMLSRTHGQPATPSTMGKELAIFVYRLQRQMKGVTAQEFLGKFNGAVGAFNAHTIAYPEADWVTIAQTFVEDLGLTYNPLTTQIEPHDYLAEISHNLIRFDNVLLDFCRDMWTYISLGYFRQRVVQDEVGSSTMPHKVNPIDFENAEANIGLSNALLSHLGDKLPISRLQRDLSDSSAMRNYGVGLAHSYLAIQSAKRGLGKVDINIDALDTDLDRSWEILGEAVQTILRKHGIENAYEQLKDLTRGKGIDAASLRAFIDSLDLPADDKSRLLTLTPQTYIGLASKITRQFLE